MESLKLDTIQNFVHYGGRFDHLFLKHIANPDIKFVQTFSKGSNIKGCTIKYDSKKNWKLVVV
jgi:hypothetical protein